MTAERVLLALFLTMLFYCIRNSAVKIGEVEVNAQHQVMPVSVGIITTHCDIDGLLGYQVVGVYFGLKIYAVNRDIFNQSGKGRR